MSSLPEKLPALEGLSHQEKDELIQLLWGQAQALTARVKELEAQREAPKKTTRNASVPPSRSPKGNLPNPVKLGEYGKKRNVKKARVHHLGGRPLHPKPDRMVIAKAKRCPRCAHALEESGQSLQAVYDKNELPPIRPMVTQVSQYGGCRPGCGEVFRAPVPLGLEAGTPFGESVQTMASYLRYSHAIGYRRLKTMFATVLGLSISEGGLANMFKEVKRRLDGEVEGILARLRKSRLICSDETGARVQGTNQWEWVFQNEQCALHVIRPSRLKGDRRGAGGTAAAGVGV
jgi:transposase